MGFLENIEKEKFLDELANRLSLTLDMKLAEVRWVHAKEYRKYYSMSAVTLYRKQSKLKYHKAMIGTGKSARFDKFFNPITLRREGEGGGV